MEAINGKIDNGNVPAAQYTQYMSEFQNVIEATNQTLTASDLNQLGKGVSEYSVTGDFYLDSGVGNAYVLAPTNGKQAPSVYNDGASFRFKPLVVNTGASTVAVAGLPVSPIFYNGVALLADRLQPGKEYTVTRDDANSRFNITKTEDSLGYRLVGHDLLLATDDQKDFSIGAQQSIPRSLTARDNGNDVYICGVGNALLHQYRLAVPWDLDTGQYNSKTFSIAAEASGGASGLFIRNDGGKIYVADGVTDILQYTLAVAGEIQTTSYDSASLDVTAQGTSVDVFFRPDGLRVFVLTTTGPPIAEVHQFTLSSAWDLNTAVYDTVVFSAGTEQPSPRGLSFSRDGRYFFIGGSSFELFRYEMETPWDLSTTKPYALHSSTLPLYINKLPYKIVFKPDGAQGLILSANTDSIFSFTTNFIAI